MALTLGQLRMHVQLALSGAPAVSTATAASTDDTEALSQDERIHEIINQAGRHLFSQRWGFNQRHAYTLTCTANVSYVALPEDCGKLLAVVPVGEPQTPVWIVGPDDIELLRQGAMSPSFGWYVCPVHVDPAAGASFGPRRLDLFPTPTTAQQFSLRYSLAWKATDAAMANSWAIHVPDYAEMLLVEYCRAVAQGQEYDVLVQRLVVIDDSSLSRRARAEDLRQYPVNVYRSASRGAAMRQLRSLVEPPS